MRDVRKKITLKLVFGLLVVLLGFYGVSAEAVLLITPPAVSGPPGSKHVVSLVTAPTTLVSVGHLVDSFTSAGGSAFPTAGIGLLSSTLTLPSLPGNYLLVATAGATTKTIGVTVTPLTLAIRSGNHQKGQIRTLLPDPLVILVLDVNGNPVAGQTVTFSVISGGGYLSPVSGRSDSNGRVETFMTLGTLAGEYTIQASVVGGAPVLFTASASAPAGSMRLHSGNNQTGPVNNILPAPFVVRILDSENKPMEDYTVRFEVTSGRGTLSDKSVRTDLNGFARVNFTPRSNGSLKIEASADGVRTLTFTVTTGHLLRRLLIVSGDQQTGAPNRRLPKPLVVEVRDAAEGPLSGITVTFDVERGTGLLSHNTVVTNVKGQAQTFFRIGTDIEMNVVTARIPGIPDPVIFQAFPEVAEPPAQPAMYWVDTGTGHLHRFFETGVENLRASVRSATGIAVDAEGRRIYWTEKGGRHRGSLHSMKLDGSRALTLKKLVSVPYALVVDPAGEELYWASSRNQIQRSNLNGKQVKSVVKDQTDITDIALDVANGKIYWAMREGVIRRANLHNGQMIQNVASGLDEPLGLAIANGMLYWTEKTGEKSGKIQSANLNGGNRKTLKHVKSVPIGIGIDTLYNRIYWTTSDGRIQRSDFNGNKVTVVLKDLRKPGDFTFETPAVETPGGGIAQTGAQTVVNQQTYSKYDVNKDGKVDNVDVALVQAADGQTSPQNPRLDVNGDGIVNIVDLIDVVENRDDAGNGAPPAGITSNLSAADRAVIQARIESLLASGDRSIAAQRALLYLQHLLASARPDETVLLANYPNPFNPETWIPYHLAESTAVKVNIYDTQGTLVRTLTVGHQPAGYYTSRSRAAYWDGRNALGERVASGIYFYQLQTDAISPMRKMVILK